MSSAWSLTFARRVEGCDVLHGGKWPLTSCTVQADRYAFAGDCWTAGHISSMEKSAEQPRPPDSARMTVPVGPCAEWKDRKRWP
jgi:hypothetical protein